MSTQGYRRDVWAKCLRYQAKRDGEGSVLLLVSGVSGRSPHASARRAIQSDFANQVWNSFSTCASDSPKAACAAAF